jgi:hypothetical protein
MAATKPSSASRTVPSWVFLSALCGIGLVSRLPQLLSKDLLLDGDECILGLMAKHIAEGRDFPIFFYGQRYGLAIVEAPLAALNFLILGVGAVPLKLAMLVLWLVGMSFYFLTLSRTLGRARSFWIAIAVVLMPAWAVSSMKAWSGYLTAFALAGALLYTITSEARQSLRYGVAGVLTFFVYLSQPSWLPGLAPVVHFFLWSSRKLSSWLAYGTGLLGAIGAMVLIQMLWLPASVESWTRPTAGNPELIRSIPRVIEQLYVNLTGSYFLRSAVAPGPITTTVASWWFAVLVAAAGIQLYRIAARRYLLWSHLLFTAIATTLLANWILLDARDVRYLLSINVLIVFLAGVELFDLVDRHRLSIQRAITGIAVVLALEAVSMGEFAHFSYMWWRNAADGPSEKQTLERVIYTMRSQGATCVFSMNALLQWQIMFYSRESVIARWTAAIDRYPPYIAEVDRALKNGERVALVGYVGFSGRLDDLVPNRRAITEVDRKYVVYMGADRPLLERLGFRFAN